MPENHNCRFRFAITLRVLNEVVPEKFEYEHFYFRGIHVLLQLKACQTYSECLLVKRWNLDAMKCF